MSDPAFEFEYKSVTTENGTVVEINEHVFSFPNVYTTTLGIVLMYLLSVAVFAGLTKTWRMNVPTWWKWAWPYVLVRMTLIRYFG